MSFLAEWYDPDLIIPENETEKTITLQERTRLSKMAAVAAAAQEVPRRLGADATSEDLSNDKKRCKRIAHVASQCLATWGGPVNNTGDVNREAAKVDWKQFCDAHQVDTNNRIRFIATWALKGGDTAWAKKAITKLTNELRWLQYAMRN